MLVTLKDGLGRIPHQDCVPLVQRRAGTLVLHEQFDESPESRDGAAISEIMPQLGLRAEPDAVLASQPETQIHVFSG
ncbi:MAG: hypothetical protein J0L61_11640, partial [Planctomycetes bacterium]|nr:hypothetical protein [Planctomycetota bacterium]